jgi:rubrerythrin
MADEADGAVEYAEKSVMFASTRPEVSKMYAEMAHDELKHAGYLKKIGETMLSENKDTTSSSTMSCWTKGVVYLNQKENEVKALLGDHNQVVMKG